MTEQLLRVALLAFGENYAEIHQIPRPVAGYLDGRERRGNILQKQPTQNYVNKDRTSVYTVQWNNAHHYTCGVQ